jgi:hypothetical protein
MAVTDKTAKKHRNLVPFEPGKSGNPAGRPKGARSKLGEDFLKALVADFNATAGKGKTNGIEAIRKMRADNPDQYVKVIAGLLPKEVTGEDGGAIDLSLKVTFA